MNTQADVLGIGNAIVDVVASVDDAFIVEHNLPKGGMTLIDEATAERLYQELGQGMKRSGGSAANTIAGVGSLGGKGAYIGKVKNDPLGNTFQEELRSLGISFTTQVAEEGPSTARCLVLVTPDAQRTMCTFLGACVGLGPEDIQESTVTSSKVTYLEGYLWDPPKAKEAFLKAADMAHQAGQKVSLTLSDPFCVDRYRDEFLELIKKEVDILFANEVEVLSLFQEKDFDDAARQAGELCETVALTRSEKGSVVIHNKEAYAEPAEPIAKVVDTTGAGDLYAAGFLFGYTHDKSPNECARLGAIAAREVISHFGARPETPLDELRQSKGL